MRKILLAVALFTTSLSFAQKTGNTLSFQKGAKLEMTYHVKSSSQAMGDTKLDVTVVRSFDVEDIVDGNAVIEHKIKSIRFEMESMLANESFDSEKEEDRKGDIGKALEKTLKAKYTMTLDPTGKVVAVESEKAEKEKQSAPQEQILLSMIEQVAGSIKPPAVGDKTEFSVLPSKELSVGESWTDSTQNRQTVYTLKAINEEEILLSYTEKLNTEQNQEFGGMSVTISSADHTTGFIKLDKATGLLREKTASTQSEGTMSVMGQSMPVNSTISKTWIIK